MSGIKSKYYAANSKKEVKSRKRLGGKSPIALFKRIYGEVIAEKLGLKELPAKDVSLKPSLIQ